jgi:hypothetical protein
MRQVVETDKRNGEALEVGKTLGGKNGLSVRGIGSIKINYSKAVRENSAKWKKHFWKN